VPKHAGLAAKKIKIKMCFPETSSVDGNYRFFREYFSKITGYFMLGCELSRDGTISLLSQVENSVVDPK
jgi:hypothetical protein